MAARLLVVEDDADLRSVLRRSLEDEGFEVVLASDGAGGLDAAERTPAPALFVLDIGLPDADGRDVCQALRARGHTQPVIFLTARDAVIDRLSGFGAGGDDYLVKPFAFAELVARIRALLRRSDGADPAGMATVLGEGVTLDPAAHAILVGDERVALTPTEFRLLAFLVARPGEAVRRADLRRSAWPDGVVVNENTLDVYVARLRRKLRDIPGAPGITTVHGVGYSLP